MLLDQQQVFRLPSAAHSEAEAIEIKFRCEDESAVLLDTRAGDVPDRLLLLLNAGQLTLRLFFANGAKHVS